MFILHVVPPVGVEPSLSESEPGTLGSWYRPLLSHPLRRQRQGDGPGQIDLLGQGGSWEKAQR